MNWNTPPDTNNIFSIKNFVSYIHYKAKKCSPKVKKNFKNFLSEIGDVNSEEESELGVIIVTRKLFFLLLDSYDSTQFYRFFLVHVTYRNIEINISN